MYIYWVVPRGRRNQNSNTSSTPPYFVGRNLDRSIFQYLQTSLVLFFSSDLMRFIQSRAHVILILPQSCKKYGSLSKLCGLVSHFLCKFSKPTTKRDSAFVQTWWKLGGRKSQRNISCQEISVYSVFSGNRKSVTIAFLSNIDLNL